MEATSSNPAPRRTIIEPGFFFSSALFLGREITPDGGLQSFGNGNGRPGLHAIDDGRKRENIGHILSADLLSRRMPIIDRRQATFIGFGNLRPGKLLEGCNQQQFFMFRCIHSKPLLSSD
ncbi:hypothetical protein Lepil_2007 [Leptonema illini DSM 21528]|uniref:Uncharacterized protein n=1 Tax=Leptonema illini DSM 21528 TaxID=929563 RepID=H2CF60_9LEPT|nr:hypothetical protein Lepil_2007 [Leptonema illini DSM 21528]